MTQNEKDLLLKDLCARLPYRVVCQCDNVKTQGVLKEIGINYNMCRLYDSFTDESENCYIFDCKPYLFPLSSMTDEQDKEFMNIQIGYPSVDWFNKNHIDYRDLIERGLAIDATGLNIY